MGKYLDQRNMNDELLYEKEDLMFFIANELAEANRLKRLELKCKLKYREDSTVYHEGTIFDCTKEELEDKA